MRNVLTGIDCGEQHFPKFSFGHAVTAGDGRNRSSEGVSHYSTTNAAQTLTVRARTAPEMRTPPVAVPTPFGIPFGGAAVVAAKVGASASLKPTNCPVIWYVSGQPLMVECCTLRRRGVF